jgi:hypothetical protein
LVSSGDCRGAVLIDLTIIFLVVAYGVLRLGNGGLVGETSIGDGLQLRLVLGKLFEVGKLFGVSGFGRSLVLFVKLVIIV